jgi:hypothetical protein
MKLIAPVTEPKSIVRYLTKLSEPLDVRTRSYYRERDAWVFCREIVRRLSRWKND